VVKVGSADVCVTGVGDLSLNQWESGDFVPMEESAGGFEGSDLFERR
jgi:hypothetical protein